MPPLQHVRIATQTPDFYDPLQRQSHLFQQVQLPVPDFFLPVPAPHHCSPSWMQHPKTLSPANKLTGSSKNFVVSAPLVPASHHAGCNLRCHRPYLTAVSWDGGGDVVELWSASQGKGRIGSLTVVRKGWPAC